MLNKGTAQILPFSSGAFSLSTMATVCDIANATMMSAPC
jgi:hypothetical protein